VQSLSASQCRHPTTTSHLRPTHPRHRPERRRLQEGEDGPGGDTRSVLHVDVVVVGPQMGASTRRDLSPTVSADDEGEIVPPGRMSHWRVAARLVVERSAVGLGVY
jgi:hypothetical protein